MESAETIVAAQDSTLDRYDDLCKYKSNLKRNVSTRSEHNSDTSRLSVRGEVSQIISRRVHFRDTIEVFSDGEETISIPLNDDFTTLPSLRSPLRKIIGRRQRLSQRYLQTNEDLYMTGELYSNVPIIVMKKTVNSTSIDLVAPLATMDDMDLFDGFDDEDDQSMSEWIDDMDDPNDYYFCGNDDLSAESDSDDVDEVMGMLLREKCLSDEEDLGMSSSNEERGEEEDEVSVDIVKKIIRAEDFFNEANIEEIESSSSTDSVADSEYLNGMQCFEEARDVAGNTMDVIPEEHFQAAYEHSDDYPNIEIKSCETDNDLDSKIQCYGLDDLRSLSNCEPGDSIPLIDSSSESAKLPTPHLVPSLIPSSQICKEEEFKVGPVNVARSKSTDFKGITDSSPLELHMKANSMVDSGFASLEMTDLESKFAMSPGEDNFRKLASNVPSTLTDSQLGHQALRTPDSQDDKFSCSSESNASGSFVNVPPSGHVKPRFMPSETKANSVGFETNTSISTTDMTKSQPNDFFTRMSQLKDKRETHCVENMISYPSLFLNLPLNHDVRLLPILTWIFNRPE